MTITIDPSSRRVMMNIKNIHKLTESAVKKAAYTSSRGLMKTTEKEILRKPKGGQVYYFRDRFGRRRRHVASAPGETHANMTGKLRRSLSFKVNPNQIEFGYGVDKNDAPFYGEFVEFGTSKMAPRPSLLNGINAERRNFQNNFEREIEAALS